MGVFALAGRATPANPHRRKSPAKKPDPQLLAFASLLYSDEQNRLAFADAAIHSDPSLAWIDFQNAILPWADTKKQHTLSAERIDRMLAADPGNDVLHLLRAESISLAYQRKDAQADPNANRFASWGKGAFRDAGGLAAMDATFKAPYYDAYDAKLFQLSREVVQRYSVSDPRVPASGLGRKPLGQYQAIRTYADVLLSRAVDAQRSGDIQSAIAHCTQILDFAQHVRAGNFYKLEAWMANNIESQAYPVLQSVYESAGRRSEAVGIAARIQGNRAQRAASSSTCRTFEARVAPLVESGTGRTVHAGKRTRDLDSASGFVGKRHPAVVFRAQASRYCGGPPL